MAWKLPNPFDRALANAVDREVARLEKEGAFSPKKKGTLVDKTGKWHTDNFNAFCEMAINDGHDIVVLKETYERVWFTIDGEKVDYDKLCKDNKGYYAFTLRTLELNKKLKQTEKEGRL